MKTKRLLLYFSLLIITLTITVLVSLFGFFHEKENVLKHSLTIQIQNSARLITDQVYGDLLIDNSLEATRKLNYLVERNIIKNFQIYKTINVKSFLDEQVCNPLYFDRENKNETWGSVCLKFPLENFNANEIYFKKITWIFVSLSSFFILLTLFSFKQFSKVNTSLFVEIEQVLKFPLVNVNSKSLWEPVLDKLRNEVINKNNAEELLVKNKIETERIHVVNQVAHDIRSPLAVLSMAISDIETMTDGQRLMIENSIQRVNEISNNLLSKSVILPGQKNNNSKDEIIFDLLNLMITEKKMEYSDRQDLDFSFIENRETLVWLNKTEFSRVISNLINNAVESIKKSGKISIIVSKNDSNNIAITITDTGCGIPNHLIEKLGERGVSYQKTQSTSSGSGLGMFHAKTTIESFNGGLSIFSEIGKGTIIKLLLPISLTKKSIEFYECVFIDDDEMLRLSWEHVAKKKNINILILKSTDEFFKYRSKIDKEKTKIYIDSYFPDKTLAGEDFALELHTEGFKFLFIASGHEPGYFAHLPWLYYSGKKCPF